MAKKGVIKKSVMNSFHVGKLAFVVGVILAAVFAVIGRGVSPPVVSAFVIIGIVIGLMNVKDYEVMPFLLSGVSLIIASAFGQNSIGVFPVLDRMLEILLVIFVPATIVVAIKNVFAISSNV